MRDKGICLIMSVWKMGILLEMITSMVRTLTYFWVWTTARTLTRFQFNRWGSASNWQVFFCRASVDPRYISIDRDSTSNRQVFRRHEFDPRYISTDRGSTSNRQVFFRRESLISRRVSTHHSYRTLRMHINQVTVKEWPYNPWERAVSTKIRVKVACVRT